MNDEIDRLAAEWAAKISGQKLTPDEQACFDSWRAADIRHMGAFARAQAILVRLDRFRAIGADALRASVSNVLLTSTDASPNAHGAAAPDFSPVSADLLGETLGESVPETPPAATRSLQWTRRQIALTGSVAAAITATGLVGAEFWDSYRRKAASAQVTYYSTRVGETRSVRLADGSVVILNTNSQMSVSYTEAVRNIRVGHGEALFKVAKNKKRPFVVTASDTEVLAVGTSFTVRLLPERPVQILVQEGVVEVARHGAHHNRPVRAVAKTQTLVPSGAPIIVQPVSGSQISRKLAWQYGRIALENETLKDAAAEFARYSDTKINVDPAVANRTITGMFDSGDSIGFAKVAASVLGLHVEVDAKDVWIVR